MRREPTRRWSLLSRILRARKVSGAATVAGWLAMAIALACGGRLENGNAMSAAGSGSGGLPAQQGNPSSEPWPSASAGGASEPAAISGAGGALSTLGIDGGASGSGGISTAHQGAGGAEVAAEGGAANDDYPCSDTTNLIAEAQKSDGFNWIGEDPSLRSDNPCGVQGVIYAFSDAGLDNTLGTSDDSLQSPALNRDATSPEERFASPCLPSATCCIKGRTSFWPISPNGREDKTASVYGAGIGISLSDLGMRLGKTAYTGQAKGFTVETTGKLNGHAIRYGYTQSPNDAAPPFAEVLGLGVAAVLFSNVECPDWSSACVPPTLHPYDLLIQVVGGDVAGDFELCLNSVTPIL